MIGATWKSRTSVRLMVLFDGAVDDVWQLAHACVRPLAADIKPICASTRGSLASMQIDDSLNNSGTRIHCSGLPHRHSYTVQLQSDVRYIDVVHRRSTSACEQDVKDQADTCMHAGSNFMSVTPTEI